MHSTGEDVAMDTEVVQATRPVSFVYPFFFPLYLFLWIICLFGIVEALGTLVSQALFMIMLESMTVAFLLF